MSEYKSHSSVAVVIPFYQKDIGLLRRCIQSILQQTGFDNYHIIIVDDGSPVSARSELADLLPGKDNITIIEQDNTGPGPARNTGIDHVPKATDYVAFIDSDDWWEPDFLQIATQVLDRGYDLFFANTVRDNVPGTRFEWHKKKKLDQRAEEHQRLDGIAETFEFCGDFFDYAIHRSSIISTSSTIYRFSCYPALRFNEHLFQGEDRLFKLSLSQTLNKVAFTPRILVHECKGLNIFDNARWGSPQSINLLYNYINLSKTILKELPLGDQHKSEVIKQLNESRYSMVASVIHLLRNKVTFNWSPVINTFKSDPPFILYLPVNLMKLCINTTHRATPPMADS